ncbi:TetR/AcrR family transcriptional regulator [Geodermatophilus sp. URMC 64]
MTEGLRERKKAKTRWAIQEHAMRLFGEQGYAGTTVDQIAAAAEISPSTFFRYFATKEDVVVQDEYDDLFVEAFRQAGRSPKPVRTLREILAGTLAVVPEDAWELSAARAALVRREPALRARSLENLLAVSDQSRIALAESAGRPADDPAVMALVGACMGVIAGAALGATDFGDLHSFRTRLDDALALLEDVDWFGSSGR